jgi:hypothetical protein
VNCHGIMLGNNLLSRGEGEMKAPEFYCEPIEVETEDRLYWPVAFVWRGRRYQVSEVLESWQDWGFGSSEVRSRTWRSRHHRNYFLVRTDSSEVFKIYYDRGTSSDSRREWILVTREA